MKDIQLSADEIKVLVSFLATSDSAISHYVMIARNMNDKEMFNLLVNEKKTLVNILEKLIKR